MIPCFNDGATLLDATSSLQRQEAHELVVVDDGSDAEETFHSRAAAEGRDARYPAAKCRTFSRTDGRCVGHVSPYVLPLDADDELAQDAVHASRMRSTAP